MKVFITGASGYIGGMLTDLFLADKNIEEVIALDMQDPRADLIDRTNKKLTWITHNLGDDGWQEKVLARGVPDVVIHCAYVIRQGYGKKRAWQNKCNITAAEKMFDFVFNNPVKRFIDFSTVASYGALPGNTTQRHFKEEDPFREDGYLYSVDKKIIEEKLEQRFSYEKSRLQRGERDFLPQVLVVRPAAVTGPRGQFIFNRFGLLQMVKEGLPIVPLTGPQSARQFIHEDDLADIIFLMARGGVSGEYEVFNVSSPDFLLLRDMAHEVGKHTIRIPMWLGRFGFTILWHVSRGKIPTVPSGIRSYTYPIIVDGSKITRYGFSYKYNCRTALNADAGRYAEKAKTYRKS